MFAKMQESFVRAGEEGTVAPIHMFYREWAVIVEIESHPDIARRLHAAEQALISDDPQARDAAVREAGEIVRAAHRTVAGDRTTGTGQARSSPRGMRAALDEHYAQYPEARPDLADIAIATAELEGNPLAADPDRIRRAVSEITAAHPHPAPEDVLLWAEARAFPSRLVGNRPATVVRR
jgi:hypothetical protein